MGTGPLLDIWREALITAIQVGAPFLVASLTVGLAMSLFQAATQMQENILSFAPKIIAVGLVLSLSGSWLLTRLTTYMKDAVELTVDIGRGKYE